MNTMKLSWVIATVSAVSLSGCSAPTGYEKAFSQTTALAGNAHSFRVPADQVFRTVKVTLVQRGFTIEQADTQSGLIRAARALQDAKDPKLAYLITSTIDISPAPAGDATIVTLSAAQQTVLHKDSNKYYKFLGLVPIPTGKDYQTVVRREGTIGSKQFYDDFFDAVDQNLKQMAAAAAAPFPEMHLAVAARPGEPVEPGTAASAPAALQVESPTATRPAATSPPAAVPGVPVAASAPVQPAAPATQSNAAHEAEPLPSLATGPNPFTETTPDKPQ
jgi:hypothetical protein